MSYKALDADEIKLTWGTFRMVRHALGGTAFGLNQIDFPPGKVGPEHDELQSGQEEVYYCISGSGTLTIDGEAGRDAPGPLHPRLGRRQAASRGRCQTGCPSSVSAASPAGSTSRGRHPRTSQNGIGAAAPASGAGRRLQRGEPFRELAGLLCREVTKRRAHVGSDRNPFRRQDPFHRRVTRKPLDRTPEHGECCRTGRGRFSDDGCYLLWECGGKRGHGADGTAFSPGG